MLYVMWCLINTWYTVCYKCRVHSCSPCFDVGKPGNNPESRQENRQRITSWNLRIPENQESKQKHMPTAKEGICMSILSSPKRANHQLPQLTKLFKGSPFNKISRWRVLTVRRPKRTSVQSNISSPSSNATYGATAPLLVGWCWRGKPEETEETGV